ncbi:MAG: DNA mismatch endonuclease Vsr [Oscillospiraceae bacterium]|nr:DNA mismatch endonuclease Vsr [Oscillospiraceae bacterium]
MADNHTKEVRSYNMSRIRSNNTKPEVLVRSYLHKCGFRFRKNDKRYPGKPDIVLPKYKTVVFVNGCFWHKHNCPKFVMPKSNTDYWIKKIDGNVKRDAGHYQKLKSIGWRVIVIWECEVSDEQLQKLADSIRSDDNGIT